ncbi:amidase family protein [Rhizobium sp. YK2]|uniref:amidase n=1 Tax=Rhizobium sp. YK2 TaxID=1860096 RepID=UPI00084C65AA|nr:amidase family protein [Rhizobium sp. YK2]OED00687.1 amidase [Rhizobium sp. YK2]
MSAIYDLSAVELALAIREKKVSPVEAVEVALDRIEAGSALNAFVTVTGERALAEAKIAEDMVMSGAELGPLHGVPYSAKDMINTAGVRTTNGSRIFADFVPKEDAVSIARAKKAGAILIGKTTTPEFGHKPEATSPVSGRTLHPTHPEVTPGASSSGAAVAVAARMGPLALGTDGGGSIRIPAACCGIVGLKATLGTIPHLQLPDLFGANSYVGPMARTVGDTALFFEAIAGFDPRDPFGQAIFPPQKTVRSLKDLKIAWLPTGGARVEREVAQITRAAIEKLASEGATIEEVDIDFKAMEPAFMTTLRVGLAARVGRHLEKYRDVMDATLIDRIEQGRALSAIDVAEATYARTAFFQTLQATLSTYDVIISPVLTAPPLPITVDTHGDIEMDGEMAGTVRGAWYPFTFPLNLTGHPAISMPCGMTKSGLPVGLQIMTGWYQEIFLLKVAALTEALALSAHRERVAN